MKSILRPLLYVALFLVFGASSYATKYTITTPGMVFSPATLTAKVGDTVIFVISSGHTATQVSQATWNANGTTPLPGGFNYSSGTSQYILEPSDQGTIYYICVPHASLGMKGLINVGAAAITYTITSGSGSGGTISPLGTATVNAGENKTYTITPNANYKIQNVLVDGASVGAVATYTFTNVQANHTIEAQFAPIQYTITSTNGSGGTINPLGTATVNAGENKTYTITPNANYEIKDVLVDGASVGSVVTYTFTNVQANHTIEAQFDPIQYTITSSSGIGGTIDPLGATLVNAGGEITYTITPDANYEIKDVLVDGESVGAVPDYMFMDVQANHSIEAQFKSIEDAVEAHPDAQLKVYPNPTSGELKVENGKWKADRIEIFDLTGRKAFETTEAEFSIAHLPAGIYVVKGNGAIRKIVKQ